MSLNALAHSRKLTKAAVVRIAVDVYRALCDVEHMRKAFPGEQLNFLTGFGDDYAERRAQELMDRDRDHDEEAA